MSGKLCLEIMPLQKGNSIYFEPDIRPIFNNDGMALSIDRDRNLLPCGASNVSVRCGKLNLNLHS